MRYLLFMHPNWYPQGGAMDLRASYDTIEKAREGIKFLGTNDDDRTHIYDLQNDVIVEAWVRNHNDKSRWDPVEDPQYIEWFAGRNKHIKSPDTL